VVLYFGRELASKLLYPLYADFLPLNFMKKPARREPSSEPSRRPQRDEPKKIVKKGGWSFNLANESLFALGSTEGARRVAYRTATGELRFLPL